MQAAVFGALAEPSRLRIVELLRTGPRSVGEIAETLDIRQPQVSKHLRVLGDSGIVVGEALARHRIYHLEAAPFEEIDEWLGSFAQLWETRLDSLGGYLESIAESTPTTTTDGKP
ncbi:DNA-binding transcriptional ArsR family regulator [Mycolicibacterium iranicum]|uniref:DNA-binding transcriptional ArsR family regulator n=1 Tax=Mycolicibacterium iranicum TaxID=912594 RepID=A0A839Q9C5_MYCIR|nr:metalloregulator ArsR/SmtB family transcription factor [Mycolicibacterium iranicum]MBB2991025.1 DNA-binding transcriptional ArsR family regulator [Mycolicibacterium iranicum]